MKCVIFANGEYGASLTEYRAELNGDEFIICADGGANYTYAMDLTPDVIIGDMDSVDPKVLDYYALRGIKIKKYPRRKDLTDLQIALNAAVAMGAVEITLFGTLGKRLDHTLANLYSGIEYVKSGYRLKHFSTELTIYIVQDKLELFGCKGDLASLLLLSDRAGGVNARGFEYPLANAELAKEKPYTVSNVVAGDKAEISLSSGIMAVFHYPGRSGVE